MSTTRITWRDALLMPEDGKRYEAIDGELYVTPAPSFRHQRVSLRLADALLRLLEERGHGWVVVAPVAVEFPTDEGVQPDIVFVSRGRVEILAEEGIRGAPDLVVEILSPATAERDRTVKKKLYGRQEVAQYWIVDPDAESVEVWDFESGASSPERYTDRLPVRLGGRSFGELDLRRVFAREL
jgi:Uma2 family endonuclease